MSKKLLLRFAVLLAAMMCALGASAAEAYACYSYTSSNRTLTFYYDNQRSSRTGTTYDLNTGSNIPGWYSDGYNTMVTRVVFDPSFANARPTTTYDWFYKMHDLQSITGMQYLNTTSVTNMGYMFSGCSGLTSLDLSSFNTSKVTDMGYMFSGCTGLATIYAGDGWSTAAVTFSGYMFRDCTSLVGGMGTAYSSSHTDANYAHIDGGTSNPGYFSEKPNEAYACYTSSNTTLTFYYDTQRSSRSGTTYNLYTGSVNPAWYSNSMSVTQVVFDPSFAGARPTSNYRWFYNMTNLQSITGMEYLNTTSVTNMSEMFYNCSGLTSLNVSGFNTTSVTNMSEMFYNCSGLTSLNVSGFNTAYVNDMNSMFNGCSGLTSLDVRGFNTANVTNVSIMFADCSGLTSLDVSNFNTSKVTDMHHMFSGCSGLTSLDLSSFKTTKVTDMRFMFNGCTGLATIYAGDGWYTAAVAESTGMGVFRDCTSLVGGQGTTYSPSHTDVDYAHIDGGPDNPGYFTEKPNEAYACYTPSNRTLTFYYDNKRNSRTGTTYDLYTGSNNPAWYRDGTNSSVTRVVFNSSFADARPTSTYWWFAGMNSLTSITGITYLNTENVTTMQSMFSGCSGLTSLNVSNFTTTNVTDMHHMFWGCSGLTSLDVSNFNTANVTSMSFMFHGCSGLTSLDLSGFNTTNVTSMQNMFYDCSGLTSLDLSNFNTAKVTYMPYMFSDCSNLTSLDLSSFNTSKVTDMNFMFVASSNLRTIYAGNGWSTEAVTYSIGMFSGCTSLVGGMGTTYDADHVDKAYAHIDGGTSNPGYFTDKIGGYTRGDVNGDNDVTIADVSALIDYLLTGDPTGVNLAAANCNGDSDVSIADVSALIDYLLTGSW